MVSMKLQGGPQLAAALAALDLRAQRSQLKRILVDAGEPMRARMAELAPTEPGAPDLSDHIVIASTTRVADTPGLESRRRDEGEAAVAIGPEKTFFYGLFQEYGVVGHQLGRGEHPGHRPHPFMRPAFDERQPATLRLVQEGIWRLLTTLGRRAGAGRGI